MKNSILYRLRHFFLIFIPAWIVGLVMILSISKRQLFLEINHFHDPIFDQFFKWETWLGNGVIFVIAVVILLIKNRGWGILGLIVFSLTAILPQLLKKLIFTDSVRPVKYYEGTDQLHLIEGVTYHMQFSFPSGHATSIAALCLLLAYLVKDKNWSYLTAIIALVTMYSRVYLAQHFLIDVLAGALLGIISAWIGIAIYKKWIEPKKGLNKALVRSKSQ